MELDDTFEELFYALYGAEVAIQRLLTAGKVLAYADPPDTTEACVRHADRLSRVATRVKIALAQMEQAEEKVNLAIARTHAAVREDLFPHVERLVQTATPTHVPPYVSYGEGQWRVRADDVEKVGEVTFNGNRAVVVVNDVGIVLLDEE